MNRFGTLLWWAILAGSLAAVALGFASGNSFGNAAIAQLHPRPARLPVPAAPRMLIRELHGPHSLDVADDERDPYDQAEAAVVERPPGWKADVHRGDPRVAVVVVDAGTAGTPARAFVSSPVPFTLVVPGGDDDGVLAAAKRAGKSVLVDAGAAGPADIRARIAAGAIGTLSDAAPDAAAAVVRATGKRGLVLDPLLDGGGASYRAARRAGVRALTRDVIADGRDGDPLIDALFGSALTRAQRSGVAVVLIHARPHSLAAAERFAVRALRDGVEIVPVDRLLARD
jgi:polysaccharide deacetylase 2 family uncharacterized protein YibQ